MNQLVALAAIPLIWALACFSAKTARAAGIMAALFSLAYVAAAAFLSIDLVLGRTAEVGFIPGLKLDRPGACFLVLTSLVAAGSVIHSCFFFDEEKKGKEPPRDRHVSYFYAATALFVLAMSAVFICDNLGFLWISVETTTLVSAPLVYFGRTRHALEATWKYLIVCSVGIAFALVGTIFIFASSQYGGTADGELCISALVRNAVSLNYPLLRLGFVFCFLGYGTKAGIFPLHSWLPDAHSEAPAPASALLSGSLLNCACFAIWRLARIDSAAGHGSLSATFCLVGGALTVIAAGLFLIRQHGLKRLWAYSSIENVGIMLVAIGLGSAPLFFLQAVNHSFAKVSLFLLSGNIIQATGTKKLSEIRGLLSSNPEWAVMLALAACAVTGLPPFGSFMSEWLILTANMTGSHFFVVASLILGLSLAFLAVSMHLGRLLMGSPKTSGAHAVQHSENVALRSAVPAALILLSVVLGVTTGPFMLGNVR